MQTVVPIGTFESKALKLLGQDGYFELITMLAKKPKEGVLIQGAGGLRKVRLSGSGRGKRGGVRVSDLLLS